MQQCISYAYHLKNLDCIFGVGISCTSMQKWKVEASTLFQRSTVQIYKEWAHRILDMRRKNDYGSFSSDLESGHDELKKAKTGPCTRLKIILLHAVVACVLLLLTHWYFSASHKSSVPVTSGKLVSKGISSFTEKVSKSRFDDPDERLAADVLREQQSLHTSSGSSPLTSKDQTFDVAQEFKAIVALSPIIIFTSLDSASEEMKKILMTKYLITPEPQAVSLNKHPHSKELMEYINTMASSLGVKNTLPGITIAGKPCAGALAVEKLHENGQLLDYMNKWNNGIFKIEYR